MSLIKKILSGGKISESKEKQTEKPSSPPIKPKTLFEEKKQWHRRDLKMKIKSASPYIPGAGSSIYSRQERKKIIDRAFPEKIFKSHISEMEAKKRLRELRKEEYQAGTSVKKQEVRRLRSFLERETGLKGKY